MAIGMELFSSRRWRLDRPKQKAVVFMFNSKNMQDMHGMIPKLFDCRADPVAHLLLRKSSMSKVKNILHFAQIYI